MTVAARELECAATRKENVAIMDQDQAWVKTVPRLAEELGTKPETLRQYAAREEDPLPIRLLPGRERGGFVMRRELEQWIERNAPMYGNAG